MTPDSMDAALHAAYADGRADEREALEPVIAALRAVLAEVDADSTPARRAAVAALAAVTPPE